MTSIHPCWLLFFVTFAFSLFGGCQLPLIKADTYGKIVDDEEKRIDKALVWLEIYSKEGPLQEIRLLTTENGRYHILTKVFGEQFSAYFFTEKCGYQEEPRTTSMDFNRVFPKNQAYPKTLFETHLAVLDRISYWFQQNPEILENHHIQTLSNFLESHFYNLATTTPEENPLRKQYLELSSLYASWYSHPEKVQNFPLIRLKLQEFLNAPPAKK